MYQNEDVISKMIVTADGEKDFQVRYIRDEFEESYSGSVGDATYKSLGFTLITEYAYFEDSNDGVYPISQEFWLFDRFLIWAWIS